MFYNKVDGDLKRNFKIHNHNTRGKTTFFIKGCDTALYQKSVINMSTKHINKLPARIRAVNKCKGFEKAVKSLLLILFIHWASFCIWSSCRSVSSNCVG